MKLLNSLWTKLASASLVLSLCIFPAASTTVHAEDTVPSPSISITGTVEPTEATPSTEVAFEIVVTNTGDCTLDPVTVNETLPDGLSYVAGSALAGGIAIEPTTSDNITLSWDLGALGISDNATITFNALIGEIEAGTLTSTAEAIGTAPDSNTVSATATTELEVYVEEPVLSPDIAITSTVDPTEATPSTEVAFEIVVTNTGDCTLDPVTINETLPDGLSYVAGSALAGGVAVEPTISGNILAWNLDALEPGDSTSITFNALIGEVEEGTLTSTIEAVGTSPDNEAVSATATAEVTILAKSYWTKADILKQRGVPGKGIDTAPGLQKPFNPNSQAAENAGKKDGKKHQTRQRTENQGNAKGKLKIRQMAEYHL